MDTSYSKRSVALRFSAMMALAACVTACKPPADDTPAPTATESPPAATAQAPEGTATTAGNAANPELRLSTTTPSHLTDAAGTSLYMLEGNRDGKKCDASCERSWPPFVATDVAPVAAAGVASDKIGTVPRGDGSSQVTYGGYPLYRYGADAGAGRTAGHDVRDQWGHWTLVTAIGEPVGEPPALAPTR